MPDNIIPAHELIGQHVSFDMLPEPNLILIAAIAKRACAWVEDYRRTHPRDGTLEPSIQIMAMDIATVHVRRGLNLKAFFDAPIDAFLVEVIAIGTRIDRTCGFFPDDVFLRYADSRLRPAVPTISSGIRH